MKEAAGHFDNAKTVPTTNKSPRASRQTLKQPTFNLKAAHKFHQLVNCEMEGKNIFMTQSYNTEDSEKKPIILNWLGHAGLHFA